MEWEQVDEDYDYHQEVARSGYADMLHDHERNRKYHVAIKAAVQKIHEMGKKAHVLDIGTGTGLLAMMAARCGADSVVACEAFPPMSKCAREIISANNLTAKIQVIPKRSTEIVVGKDGDMKHKANILVTEVFDTELIGEGAISTFNHAHKELLEPNCIIVPSKATIYAQVVECPLALTWHQPAPWTTNNQQVVISIPPEVQFCTGSPAVHDVQLSQIGEESFCNIISPFPVFKFDWSGETGAIPFHRSESIEVKAESSGRAQVVFMWWDLQMDQDGDVLLSCAPYWAHPSHRRDGKKIVPEACGLPWRDHWMQAIYYLPSEQSLFEGDTATLKVNHDEYSLWFDLQKGTKSDGGDGRSEHPVCTCGIHASFGRTRIGNLSDEKRRHKYASALCHLFKQLPGVKSGESDATTIICLSEGSLLGLFAAKLAEKILSGQKWTVVCEDGNSRSLKVWRELIHGNQLSDSVEILERVCSVDHLGGSKASMLIGEPHFCCSLLPWHNLHFWYRKSQLSHLLHSNAVLMPVGAVIWAMAVQFTDLWKIRAPVHSVEGFEMEKFDQLIESSSSIGDELVEPQPLWEYPCRALSQPCKLFEFDFHQTFPEEPIIKRGVFHVESEYKECNGIAIWVDWDLDGNPEHIISTGPTEMHPELGKFVSWDIYTRQGVRLLSAKSLPINFEAHFFPFKCDLSLLLQAETSSASGKYKTCGQVWLEDT